MKLFTVTHPDSTLVGALYEHVNGNELTKYERLSKCFKRYDARAAFEWKPWSGFCKEMEKSLINIENFDMLVAYCDDGDDPVVDGYCRIGFESSTDKDFESLKEKLEDLSFYIEETLNK